MNGLMYPDLREIWVACGTKWGKTAAASIALSKLALNRTNIKTRWIAPIYRQSLIGMEYFQNLLPPKPHSQFKQSQMIIDMPLARNVLEFWHGQNPYDLEGAAINGAVLDECAKMKEQVYISSRTTTTRTKGPFILISTPIGKNWFFTRCMEAKEHQEWAIKKGVQPTKIFITAPTSDNPYIDPEVLRQAQRELPARLYDQHYRALFLDDGSVFTNIMECCYTDKIQCEGSRQSWQHDDCKNSTVVIAVDWAKTQDYTVMMAADIATRKIVAFDRFHRIPYTEQIRKLGLFAKRFASVEMVFHDKTGVGTAIDDHLAYLNLPYHGITFSNSLKGEMVAKLITSLEQVQIQIPWWPELIKELVSYELKTSITGLPTYSAPPGKHDDIVTSLFLANMALLEYSDKSYQINYLEELTAGSNDVPDDLQSYYNEITEDD